MDGIDVGLADANMAETLRQTLPCERCRLLECHVANLPRLGKHERAVLDRAASPDSSKGVQIRVIPKTRAADEAVRRSMRKLEKAGLACLDWQRIKTEVRHSWNPVEIAHRVIRRSALGQAVWELAGDDIKAGKRIRWDKYRQALIERTRWYDRDRLLSLFVERLKTRYDNLVFCDSLARVKNTHIPEVKRVLEIVKQDEGKGR